MIELEEMAVVKQGRDKHISITMGVHITIEELLGALFIMQCMPRL
jgi:hypothetical protein